MAATNAPTADERERYRAAPAGPHVMYQKWLELLFVHYALEPELVQRLLPKGLTIDTFPDASGRPRAWVGVVPFRMHDVRPRFLPGVPGSTRFLEANLRTYVHVEGRAPAVWFFSLDAANALACWVARKTYQLPYHHARMASRRDGDRFTYRSDRWHGPAHLDAQWRIGAPLGVSAPGTLEHFLAERYLLVAHPGGGGFRWGRVHHAPYELRAATLERWSEGLSAAASLPGGEPAHVCYCEGVDTRVWPIRREA